VGEAFHLGKERVEIDVHEGRLAAVEINEKERSSAGVTGKPSF
jgi:hypothetical protein